MNFDPTASAQAEAWEANWRQIEEGQRTLNTEQVVEIKPGATWYCNVGGPFRIDKVENGRVFYTPIGGNPGLTSGSHIESDFRYYFNSKPRD